MDELRALCYSARKSQRQTRAVKKNAEGEIEA
jgi:hypothetical protein